MKTGDKYFRYGQTGIRPEDFTGPCPQCVTECNDEARRMFQKFNFWSVDSGAIGEKVHFPATPGLGFSVGGGYELWIVTGKHPPRFVIAFCYTLRARTSKVLWSWFQCWWGI